MHIGSANRAAGYLYKHTARCDRGQRILSDFQIPSGCRHYGGFSSIRHLSTFDFVKKREPFTVGNAHPTAAVIHSTNAPDLG
jgi:hypothetical protein